MFKKVAFTYYPVTDVLGRASSTRRRSASSPARPATRATTGGWNTTCPAAAAWPSPTSPRKSCPYRKSHPLAREANRAMLPPDVGRLQIDLVAANRVIPIESDG
jgi:hypothetical protein